MGENTLQSLDLHGSLSDRDFDRLSKLIQDELGIKMPPNKRTMLQSRLTRRLRTLKIATFREYADWIHTPQGMEEELREFVDLATTNKTSFFRESDHFDYLAHEVVPSLRQRGIGTPQRPIKVWSAGCSTGEEPYTIALVLADSLGLHRNSSPFQIFASDISSRVLRHALAAVYTEEQSKDIPDALRRRWLLRSRDPSKQTVRVGPLLRSTVHFEALNFNDEHYEVPDSFDVVFIRNVLIYFDADQQRRIVGNLLTHMNPSGTLFVGHSESLQNLGLPIKFIGNSIYLRL